LRKRYELGTFWSDFRQFCLFLVQKGLTFTLIELNFRVKALLFAPPGLIFGQKGMKLLLVEYLNVMSRVNTAVYGALQAEVSELAHTLNTKIQMRLGHRAANDPGDETSETTEII
jgi:hypothetical protein